MGYNVHSIFSTPVLESTLEVSSEIVDYVNLLQYTRTDSNNADISELKNILDHSIFFNYSKQINALVDEFVFAVSKFDKNKLILNRVASWVNRHHYADWAQNHFHANSFVSGVWYLETSENCGDLIMQNPYVGFGIPLEYSKTEDNEYNSNSCIFPAIKNKIYIFPSTLRHSVCRNETKNMRTSIAFNYYARGMLATENNIIYS